MKWRLADANGVSGKMAEVQCRSLLVTERRTVGTIATTRHLPFISRHRQMKNHSESATCICINITKAYEEGMRGRERGHSNCPPQIYPM